MKKIFIILLLTTIGFNVEAKFTKIYREKVGGNKTNKFETVDRTVNEGSEVISVYINCTNPGDKDCPTAKPLATPDPNVGEVNIDPAIAEYLETIYLQIDNSFDNGVNNGEEMRTIVVVNPDGNESRYTIKFKWYQINGNIQKSEIEISDHF
jgi:hypothetical protein